MIVLDANVAIGFLDADDPHHDATLSVLEHHFQEEFALNVLTLAEVLVHPSKAGRQDAALASLKRLGVRVVPIGDDEALSLSRVRADYAIRMPDAVVLHTALSTGSALATFDAALGDAARQAGLTVYP